MKSTPAILLIAFASVNPALADTSERLGTVSFPVSCAASQQPDFNRGIALVHDFWYEEARRQFEQILKADPACAIAHWGIAMSIYHQIWNRPNEATMVEGWSELRKAQPLRRKPAASANISPLSASSMSPAP